MLRWLTRNICDTETATHADVGPLELPIAPEVAVPRIAEVAGGLWGWKIDAVEGQTIRARRRTKVLQFVDDVIIRVDATEYGCRVHARSQSRLGKGDLGQNRRNVRELFRAIRKGMAK